MLKWKSNRAENGHLRACGHLRRRFRLITTMTALDSRIRQRFPTKATRIMWDYDRRLHTAALMTIDFGSERHFGAIVGRLQSANRMNLMQSKTLNKIGPMIRMFGTSAVNQSSVVASQRDSENLSAEERINENVKVLQSETWLDDYLRDILRAQGVVYDCAKETELMYLPSLSDKLENHIYLKREDQQPVNSFKIRGAYNKIASVAAECRERGIVACSAGNHAQGVALASQALGIENLILMPVIAPKLKVDAVRSFGGNVLLHGNNFDEAQAEAMRFAREGRMLIHPFDDPLVIAGQGTIGIEILKQLPMKHKCALEAVFCGVGGGGLLAGMSVYVKKINPGIRMIGVEAHDAAGMTASLEAGEVVSLDQVGLFADGASVRTVGKNTFRIIKTLCDRTITTSTDEICHAIKVGFNETRVIFEPAGALGLAGLIQYVENTGVKGKTFVAVASGANMDFDRLRFVSERADSSENLIAVSIPESDGEFFKLYQMIYPRNVTEFSYRCNPNSSLAHIVLNFQSNSAKDKRDFIDALASNDRYEVLDLADNDLAKTHIRHLGGGRAIKAGEERLFRLVFPERPGSLREFLDKLSDNSRTSKTVTLFHYRNHGADIGRVLVGLRAESNEALDRFINDLGFSYIEETDNPAYHRFLVNTDEPSSFSS